MLHWIYLGSVFTKFQKKIAPHPAGIPWDVELLGILGLFLIYALMKIPGISKVSIQGHGLGATWDREGNKSSILKICLKIYFELNNKNIYYIKIVYFKLCVRYILEFHLK